MDPLTAPPRQSISHGVTFLVLALRASSVRRRPLTHRFASSRISSLPPPPKRRHHTATCELVVARVVNTDEGVWWCLRSTGLAGLVPRALAPLACQAGAHEAVSPPRGVTLLPRHQCHPKRSLGTKVVLQVCSFTPLPRSFCATVQPSLSPPPCERHCLPYGCSLSPTTV